MLEIWRSFKIFFENGFSILNSPQLLLQLSKYTHKYTDVSDICVLLIANKVDISLENKKNKAIVQSNENI